jgi:hypothetical protein
VVGYCSRVMVMVVSCVILISEIRRLASSLQQAEGFLLPCDENCTVLSDLLKHCLC